MRPLFAIAPLALTLALLGPSQASPTEPSWVRAVLAWVFDGDPDGASRAADTDGDQRQATFLSTMESR